MNLTNNKKNLKLSLVTMERACGRCNQWAPCQTDRGGPEFDCKTEGGALLPRNEILNADGPSGPAPFLAPAPRQLRTALVIKKDRWKKYISIYINIFLSQKCCVPLRNFEFSQKYCIPQ